MYRRGLFVSLCLLAFTCSEAEDAPDDLTAACRRDAECAGEPSTPEYERSCREGLLAEYDEASSYGCAAQHADWVSCLATTRGQCRPALAVDFGTAPEGSPATSPEEPEYVDPCQAQREAFRRCQGEARRDECVVLGFGGAGGCNISCALFEARCDAPMDGPSSSCSCEDGAQVGAAFTSNCGEEDGLALARDACQ